MYHVTIYADGSSKRDGSGGWSCLLSCGQHWSLFHGNTIVSTNNRMELTAVVVGLTQLTAPCEVTVVTDSQLVVNTINTWVWSWAKNDFRKKTGETIANRELVETLYTLLRTHRVKAVWVRGHTTKKDSNSLGNQCCDWFAQYR